MYESFYGFREKPFSLLPDAGFLYLSAKHRMALTLLEYGLMNQAGFTAITGQIGTGKTTLIRHLLTKMEQQHRVGLISNTHRSFGELLQWILMAYGLPHAGKSRVEMYQDFMNFIIGQYGAGKRTILIVDEAQNMAPETLEELRMLSNVNADKDQVLQIILVGQKELRETLRRPDLIQFAQRIAVDYHLDPLQAEETPEYIRHRLGKAGGDPELFEEAACARIHQASGGVPRLINLLCDTALVYGFAEQTARIGTELVDDVIRDKQQGGLFPHQPERPLHPMGSDSTDQASSQAAAGSIGSDPVDPAADLLKKKLRVAIACEADALRDHLSTVLSTAGVQIIRQIPLRKDYLDQLDPEEIDILLVDLDEDAELRVDDLYEWLNEWDLPVLFNESIATERSLKEGDQEFGRKLTLKLLSLLPEFSPPSPWQH